VQRERPYLQPVKPALFTWVPRTVAWGQGRINVNHRETRIMRPGLRQSLAGIVVNDQLNLRRRDLETLEAILTNCARFCPESQNRQGLTNFRAHLDGRIGFVEMINRTKGRRLRTIFQAIRF
jgi:RNA-directed DNA polymerase